MLGSTVGRSRRIRSDAFGPRAPFIALVAELDGAVAGSVFFSAGYNTDLASRSMWLHDLYVVPAARRRGVGYALMAAVAAETVRSGCESLEWGVHAANTGALEFYRRLGAGGAEVRIMAPSARGCALWPTSRLAQHGDLVAVVAAD